MTGAPSGNASLDLASLPARLNRIATPADCDESSAQVQARLLRDVADLARQSLKADRVLMFQFCDDLISDDVIESPPTPPSGQQTRDRSAQLAEVAFLSGRTEIDRCPGEILIATVVSRADRSTVMVSSLRVGSAAIEPFVVTQQLVMSSVELGLTRWSQRKLARSGRQWQQIAELRQAITASDDFAVLARSVVDRIAIDLNAHQVALAVKRGHDVTGIEIAAVGGEGTPVAESLWRATASEAIVRGGVSCWPTEDRNESAATIAHRELAHSVSLLHQAVSVPLGDGQLGDGQLGDGQLGDGQLGDGPMQVVLVAVTRSDHTEATHELTKIGNAIWPAIDDWKRQHRGPLARAGVAIAQFPRTRMGFLVAVLLTAILAMIPVPYRIAADATIVPQTRSFVVAPHRGLIRTTHVRVGDLVQRGTPIVVLDDRELQIELASLTAERDRVAKQRDVERANGNVAAEQLAEHDLARVHQQIKLVRQKLDDLTIVSPIDGVVLSGDLEGVSGAPIETGQLLVEIAMLEQVWIEAHVGEEELSELRHGQGMRVAFDALDNRPVIGKISTISPSAQIHGGKNVFVVRAGIDNSNGQLRPGIRGVAKINGDRRPLIAVLMRHVWRHLCRVWV